MTAVISLFLTIFLILQRQVDSMPKDRPVVACTLEDKKFVVTVLPDKGYLAELFYSRQKETSSAIRYEDPLKSLYANRRDDLCVHISDSIYFKTKKMYYSVTITDFTSAELRERSHVDSKLYENNKNSVVIGNTTEDLKTFVCKMKVKGINSEEYFHFSDGYKPDSYFISKMDDLGRKIVMIGIVEPAGVVHQFETKAELEDQYITRMEEAYYALTPDAGTPAPVELSPSERLRLCVQVFGSRFYRAAKTLFSGDLADTRVAEKEAIAFEEPQLQNRHSSENFAVCSVSENQRLVDYYISAGYDRAAWTLYSVFVFRPDDDQPNRKHLHAFVTYLAVLRYPSPQVIVNKRPIGEHEQQSGSTMI